MALPTPTVIGFLQIPNNGFEAGPVDWTTSGTANIVNEAQLGGAWCVKVAAAGEANDGGVITDDYFPVVPNQNISLTAVGQMTTGTPGTSFSVALHWYDSAFGFISATTGSQVNRASIGGAQGSAAVGGTAPANAAYVRAVGALNTSASGTTSTIFMDNFSWNYNFPVDINLTHPLSTYSEIENIPFRVNASGLPAGVTITSVEYWYMTWDGADYIDATLLATETTSPFAFNSAPFAEGQYGAYAVVTLSTGLEITTNSRVFTVGDVPPADTREFKASNSYTYLIGENFAGLGGAIPATAIVTGAEIVIGYSMDVLVRSKDIDVTDPATATPEVAFATVTGGSVEAVLLDKSGSEYTISGAAMTSSVPINIAGFNVVEDGISNEHRWTVYELDTEATTTIGGSALLFGQNSISAADFIGKSIGVRFTPTLGTKPDYADSGEACYRFKINTLKLRVYFDAGSVEYYFASPDKTNVIKGELAASYVTSGDLATGDATGTMQLLPDLEVIDGSGDVIGADWTIHSFYPVTDANQIGLVAQDMEYNGLPTYNDVELNRSRYVFITANFYGDPLLDSIYGANGVDRAFAYNGDYFYKIYTHPEDEKDKPRHVAFHHSHLALGFGEGRVDLSVVGEPYNFEGVQGASSWAIGDNVTGLLPLSGTMLGIFCKKSVWGLSGTTVDNFATQVISPRLGAVEYTVTDMGFPVYANAYGIYTLAQTQEYGDYLGSPMSQPISPWLRPRLIRKAESDKEVVVAWPVRSKNQYKLAFADGYVLSMTMNYGRQQAPTFAKQKYFISDEPLLVGLYEYPSIVPAAISSELDDSGEERIHIANKQTAVPAPAEQNAWFVLTGEGNPFLLNLDITGFDVESEVTVTDVSDVFTGYPHFAVAWEIVTEGDSLGDTVTVTQGTTELNVVVNPAFSIYIADATGAGYVQISPEGFTNQTFTLTVEDDGDYEFVWDEFLGYYTTTFNAPAGWRLGYVTYGGGDPIGAMIQNEGGGV